MSRLDFLRGQTNEVSAPLALGALNNRWKLAAPGDFDTDLDVLNYALTLEYLEAEFYVQGNAAGLVKDLEKKYLDQIGADEAAHVQALTDTIKSLGGTPVEKPWVDFGGAFDSREAYLTTSHTFENVGVGAYLGAAGFVKDKAILQAAAGIFGVEARHAAIVGELLGLAPEGGVYMSAYETPIEKAKVLEAVAPFITSQMDGTPSGAADTGGGSTARGNSSNDTGLLIAGGAAVLGAAGAIAYGKHQRVENEPTI